VTSWRDELAAMRAAAKAISDAVDGLEKIASEISALNERRIKAGLKPIDAEQLFSLARAEALTSTTRDEASIRPFRPRS